MAERTIEPGDVVTLKSGSPALTALEVGGTAVTCMWYAEDEEVFRTAEIPSVALSIVEEEDEIEIEDEDEDDEDEDEDED